MIQFPDQGGISYTDDNNVQWFKYAAQFGKDGEIFGFEIWATSDEDAERRVGILRETATIEGRIFEEITLDES